MGLHKDHDKRRALKELREQGLSFAEIGKRVGTTKQAVQRTLADTKVTVKLGLHCRQCDYLIYVGERILWTRQTALCLACLGKMPEASFADRLKALRVARGLSQVDLAREATLSRSTIRQFESGEIQNPKFNTLRKLVKILGAKLVAD